ncbi:hypothetical protein AX16_002229 [Volvariella volvacea WC 439]|nr:hypothetical protein AX16_002229 [Volvariella volvacea WC 439]
MSLSELVAIGRTWQTRPPPLSAFTSQSCLRPRHNQHWRHAACALQDSRVSNFTKVFEGKDVVYWGAGVGGHDQGSAGARRTCGRPSELIWYMDCNYKADLNLATRTLFKWTILRPGTLLDIPGTGKVSLGKVPISTVPVGVIR